MITHRPTTIWWVDCKCTYPFFTEVYLAFIEKPKRVTAVREDFLVYPSFYLSLLFSMHHIFPFFYFLNFVFKGHTTIIWDNCSQRLELEISTGIIRSDRSDPSILLTISFYYFLVVGLLRGSAWSLRAKAHAFQASRAAAARPQQCSPMPR